MLFECRFLSRVEGKLSRVVFFIDIFLSFDRNIYLNVLKTAKKSLNDADSFDDCQPSLSKLKNRQRCQKP